MLPMATSDVCELFGVSGIPMIVVVHPNGMITLSLTVHHGPQQRPTISTYEYLPTFYCWHVYYIDSTCIIEYDPSRSILKSLFC